jgi:Chaperone of endosialidase
MGKKSSTAPKPPDPKAVASAQTAANIATALAEGAINRIDQVTPDGSLTYRPSGVTSWRDPLSGKVYEIPSFTATTALSPGQQKIKAETDAAGLNLAAAANAMSGRADKEPFKVDEAVESRLFDLGAKRLQPQLDAARRKAETEAANRGLRLGSESYDLLMRQVGEKENDAWTQLALSGRAQAYGEADADYNRDLNRINALLSGSQVSAPSFVNTPKSNVAGTDYAGLVNSTYQQKLAAWQQQQQNQNDLLGGLFGIGAAFAGNPALKFSDRRLKENVTKIGETSDGLKIYSYHYKGDRRLQLGLMADEVKHKRPTAVVTLPGGFKAVDYYKALHLGAARS